MPGRKRQAKRGGDMQDIKKALAKVNQIAKDIGVVRNSDKIVRSLGGYEALKNSNFGFLQPGIQSIVKEGKRRGYGHQNGGCAKMISY